VAIAMAFKYCGIGLPNYLHAVAAIIAGGFSFLWVLFDVTTVLLSSYSGVTMLIFWVGYKK
jgi:hypothetical protein